MLALVVCVLLAIRSRTADKVPKPWPGGPVPQVAPGNAYVSDGAAVKVEVAASDRLWFSSTPREPLRPADATQMVVQARPDRLEAERLLVIPTAVAWARPMAGLPAAQVLRMAVMDEQGRMGPTRMHTLLFADHGELPVVSLAIDEGAFFDPDTGIYVVGHADLHPTPAMEAVQAVHWREWWMYPGNFHFKGREWERAGAMQLIGADGAEVFASLVRIRINGEITRGRPQHSLRFHFDDPVPVPFFPDGDGAGTRSLVLRASGNDQRKALLRDLLANRICAGRPFETARAMPCVVYVNGTYWGVHQLQQRMDERELARRHGIAKKQVALLDLRQADGRFTGHADVAELEQALLAIQTADPAGPMFATLVARHIDVDGFLHYMAAEMVLGNADWPHHNVRVWRYTGPPQEGGPLDGRWRFILTDLDHALGFMAGPETPLDRSVQRFPKGPVSRLFLHLMDSPTMREQFDRAVQHFVSDALLSGTALQELERLERAMEHEMPRHIDRWRSPATLARWRHEVEVVRRFLRDRAKHVVRDGLGLK